MKKEKTLAEKIDLWKEKKNVDKFYIYLSEGNLIVPHDLNTLHKKHPEYKLIGEIVVVKTRKKIWPDKYFEFLQHYYLPTVGAIIGHDESENDHRVQSVWWY